jgi:hypothetical protein
MASSTSSAEILSAGFLWVETKAITEEVFQLDLIDSPHGVAFTVDGRIVIRGVDVGPGVAHNVDVLRGGSVAVG